jgi:hypothetical protein
MTPTTAILLRQIDAEYGRHQRAILHLRNALAMALQREGDPWADPFPRHQLISPAELVGHVLNLVARETHHTVAALRSHQRPGPLVRARHASWWLIRQLVPTLTSSDIAKHYEDRDHSAILHGLAMTRSLRELDPQFAATLDRWESELRGTLLPKAA